MLFEWVKCDSKGRNICMTGRKKCLLVFVKLNNEQFGCLPICDLNPNAPMALMQGGCGSELSRGTIQTSHMHFLLCKQVSSEVSRQLRLLRYQASLSQTHAGILPAVYRSQPKVKFTFSASVNSHSSMTSSRSEELGHINTASSSSCCCCC